MPQDEKATVELPESLRGQFAGLRHRLFRVETLFAAALALTGLLSGFLLLFVSDRLWDSPAWLRALLLIFPILGAAAAAAWWLRRWVIQPRDLEAFAVLVQKKFRRLGDRLLGIVELSEEAKRPAHFSPELYQAAIRQVADESAKYDFTQAADARPARRQWITGAALFALVVVAALLLPEAAWNSFRRWAAPFARIPRFTLVELAGLPSEMIVPHGEKAFLSGEVKHRSFWKPARVKLEWAGGRALLAEAQGGVFRAELPPQTQDAALIVRAGDAEHELKLLARHRPAIEQASARVRLPEYLGYPEHAESAQGGMIEVVEGSSLHVEARTSRALRGAWLEIPEQNPVPLTVLSNTFATPILPADKLPELAVRWVDQLGLSNTAPWKLAIQTRRDQPPVPEIEELYRDTAILETEVLPIPIRANDDYGLKEIGIAWSSAALEGATNAVARREVNHPITGRDTKYLEHEVNFSPAVLGLAPESTVEIRAYAVDHKPGRERSESPVYRIHVLGNAQHAEMIRQNLESLLVELEEVTRLEEKIASETRDIKDLQKLDAAETGKKIAELQREQQQNAAQLQQMAEEGMKTLREALRNPAFTEEVLGDWAKNLQQMQKVSQEQMQQASKSLQSAAQKSDQREENLAEAEKQEQESLAALQQMQQKVNQGLDELQALTLAQRLRHLSGKQKRVETTLGTNIPDTIGLIPGDLPPRYQKANQQLAGVQSETQADSVKIQGEISRFFERTQKPNYGEVSKQMADSKAGEELERVRGLIQENIGMEAMQNLALWADRFDAWAGQLEPKSEDSGSGSGQGEGSEQQEDAALKQLLGLLRLRERQVNVRARTELLHSHIDEKIAYRDGAVLLAASQAKLNRDLTKQAVDNVFTVLEEPYSDALTAMTDVETLLDRPRTDEITATAQDKSISRLTDLVNLLNEQAQKSSSSSSQKSSGEGREQMAFLMQMMAPQQAPGMKPGQAGGGNFSGGTTDKVGSGATGDVAGKAGEGRSTRKSSSVPQNYPSEFREALQNYFKALEQNGPAGGK